jgi:hypothetical protein
VDIFLCILNFPIHSIFPSYHDLDFAIVTVMLTHSMGHRPSWEDNKLWRLSLCSFLHPSIISSLLDPSTILITLSQTPLIYVISSVRVRWFHAIELALLRLYFISRLACLIYYMLWNSLHWLLNILRSAEPEQNWNVRVLSQMNLNSVFLSKGSEPCVQLKLE